MSLIFKAANNLFCIYHQKSQKYPFSTKSNSRCWIIFISRLGRKHYLFRGGYRNHGRPRSKFLCPPPLNDLFETDRNSYDPPPSDLGAGPFFPIDLGGVDLFSRRFDAKVCEMHIKSMYKRYTLHAF